MDQKVIFCSNISNNYAEKTIEEIIFSRKKSASYWYHVVLYSVLAYWICLVNCQKCWGFQESSWWSVQQGFFLNLLKKVYI